MYTEIIGATSVPGRIPRFCDDVLRCLTQALGGTWDRGWNSRRNMTEIKK